MLEEVIKLTLEFLNIDKSGHGDNHALRVYNLAMKFAKEENADMEIVGIAAILHDVDDYKMVGIDKAHSLENAKNIMKQANVEKSIQNEVIDIIKNMGYKNYLNGIRPKTLEGKIVSDADMCDALGAHGIIRSIMYSCSDKGSGVIFDKNIWPNVNMTALEYNSYGTTYDTDNSINYCFEKLLKLKNLMMTNSGKMEALERHEFIISFLRQFFKEENLGDWIKYLDDYLDGL